MDQLFESRETLIVEEQVEVDPSLNVESPTHQKPMETVLEIEVLKRSLQHYKSQNGYLNDSNDKLMKSNIRLREYLE